MTIETYLREKYSRLTAKAYQRDIKHYLSKQKDPQSATYEKILQYLEGQRKPQSPASLNRILQSVKKYYDYLLATKKRKDHPCERLKIRDHYKIDIQLQDLFTREELESLLERKERYAILKNRNQLVLSLLIYQGITTGELIRLSPRSLDLEKGELHLPSSHRLNGRSLNLKPNQILAAYQYIHEDRPKLLKTISDQLLITKKGTAENGEGISYLVSTQQARFANKNLNPKTIRQSVIANLLASGKDLRWVQIYAGHKYPSSTERYRQSHLEGLREAIKKYHPLD